MSAGRICPPCQRKDHEHCASRSACGCPVCESLVWGEPPRRRHSRPAWLPSDEVLDVLRRTRRECRVWAGNRSSAYKASSRIRGGGVPQLPAAHWEAFSAALPDGQVGLWLRYVGPEIERRPPCDAGGTESRS